MNEKIIVEIDDRKISRLCHFTNFISALKILKSEKGILATEFIDTDVYNPNDIERYDGKADFICCSVEYPNTWYLEKIRNKDPLFDDWIVLFINPYLAAMETSEYCTINAATDRGRYINNGYDGFAALFQYQIPIGRRIYRSPKMLNACPTDGQAEVLIYKNISRDDIIGLAVENINVAARLQAAFDVLSESCDITDIDIYIAPKLFENSWNRMIRNGDKPEELLYK